jgi:hypothetical protein
MQCVYGQMQTSIYNFMHQYREQKRHALVCVNKSDMTQKCQKSRLLKPPHVFHKLLLVNQSLELAIMQNADVSKA